MILSTSIPDSLSVAIVHNFRVGITLVGLVLLSLTFAIAIFAWDSIRHRHGKTLPEMLGARRHEHS